MKAIQIVKPGVAEMIDIPIAQPAENEVLLKIALVGMCGSDLSTYLGKNPLVQYPRIPGHEVSAKIVELGAKVPGHIKKGDLVTVVPYSNCGSCSSCRNGREYACRYNQTLGVQRDGALTEYIAVPWTKIVPAKGLNETELALTEPLTVGFHAVSRASVTDSDTVMVLGCGMIGAGAIIRSVLRGAEVIAVDIDDNKLALAKKLGAAHTFNSRIDNVHENLEQITGGHGPSVVIEAVGNAHTYVMAIEEVAFSGRVVYIGYVKDEVAIATRLIVQKELDILGSRNASPRDFDAVVKYIGSGKCPVESLVSGIISPEEVGESMQSWADNPGKVQKILVRFD